MLLVAWWLRANNSYSSTYAEAWLRRRRATPSFGTGPHADHTAGDTNGLGGNGYYMYFEVRRSGQSAKRYRRWGEGVLLCSGLHSLSSFKTGLHF